MEPVGLIDGWLRAGPRVRGYAVEDAEVRVGRRGRCRLAVRLWPADPDDTVRIRRGTKTEVRLGGAAPPAAPAAQPVLAFADFDGLAAVGQFLRGQRPADFYFDGERPASGDPLRD